MSEHTPGPWRRFANSIKSRKAGCVIVRLPALTDRVGDETPEQIERWDADARLIAAAPELLEALELALGSHNRLLLSDPPKDAWVFNEVEAKARAAIAKAKGEE